MNALQPSRPPLHPQPTRSTRPRSSRHDRRRAYATLAFESATKAGITLVLSVVAISALAKIIPYYLMQQSRLEEMQSEVKLAEARVNRLQGSFERYFDPQQSRSVMQEQSYRFDPKQRRIIWLNKP